MYQTSDIRKGLKIELDGQPFTITYFQFVKPGKGCAFTRTKCKNLLTGAVLERTYKTGEALKPADVETSTMQYLYNDDEFYYFMHLETYEQIAIPGDTIGKDTTQWMIEEMECEVMSFKGRPVNVELPNFVELEITYCEPGVRGNTATGATKVAELSTGATVSVPLFVEQNTWIKVDTRSGEYVERVNK